MKPNDIHLHSLALKRQNAQLKRELRRYRKSLRSTLNILDPEQRAIIRHDLFDIDQNNSSSYAQSEF